MFINRAHILGNLTRDPESKELPSGGSVCNFSIATNRVYKDKSGRKVEQAEFHNIVAFGRTAEIVAQYATKGSSLYVEGRLQTRSWEKDGVKHYRTEILAENVQLGPRKAGTTPNADVDDATGAIVADGAAPNPDVPF